MKYLRSFATLADYTTAKSGQEFYYPCVSLIEGTMEILYDPYVAPVEEEPASEEPSENPA